MPQQQDWFASNAPKDAAGDWFATNAAKAAAQSPQSLGDRIVGSLKAIAPEWLTAKVGEAAPRDTSKRPLLTGPTDAGVAAQLGNDPQAIQAFQDAKNRGENIGAGLGLAAAGGMGAAGAPGLAQGIGKAALWGGAYKAATMAGVPPEWALLGTTLLGGQSAKNALMEGIRNPRGLTGNEGGRLIMEKPPAIEQQMADVLAQLRGGNTAKATTLPPPAELPPGYTPRTAIPKVASPSGLANLQSSALDSRISGLPPTQPNRPTFPNPIDATYARVLQNRGGQLLQATPPSDMPRSWHAFLNDAAREQAAPEQLKQASALHRELADMDARYRAATVNERAQMQALPASFKSALVAALTGGNQ